MSPESILDKLCQDLSTGRRAAFCVIVATRGSTPQPPGTMLVIDQDAQLVGTLGGGCVEAEVRRLAHQSLAGGVGLLHTFALDNDFGYDDGMICGGQMDVAIEVVTDVATLPRFRQAIDQLKAGSPATIPLRVPVDDHSVEYRINIEATPQLLIAGAGHISRVLAQAILPLGFRIHVIDDRAEFANAERFQPPVTATAGPIAETLASLPIGENTYIVIVTRGHRHDEAALQAVLDSKARYIGMIGSPRKVKVIFDDLRHAGATEQQLEKVNAPVGLDIGAVTTDEIAVSIAAQLVAVRRAERTRLVEGPFPATGEAS